MFNDSYHFVRDFCRTNEVFRFTRTRYPRTLEQMTRCLFLSTHTVCVVGRSPTVSGFFLVLLTCVLGRLRIFRVFQRRLQPEGRDPVRTLQPASASFLALASSALRWLCSRCRCAISFQVDPFPTLVPLDPRWTPRTNRRTRANIAVLVFRKRHCRHSRWPPPRRRRYRSIRG